MNPLWWRSARILGAAAVLGALVWRLGAGPFLDGLGKVDGWSLAAAAGIAVVTTASCAWRWAVVARGIGVEVPLVVAVGASYRAQFLNLTLPGGIVGDLHRAVDHGRGSGDVGRSARAVAWERTAGQVVQLVLTVGVLLVLPSPVQRWAVPAAAVLVAAAAVGVLLGRGIPHPGTSLVGTSRRTRALRTAAHDVRTGVLARRSWPVVVLASCVVVLGHTATFMIAARTAGADVAPARLFPLALLVLAAMSLPTSIGGWGPREGAAAAVFAMAGLGAGLGVATAVVYGVMVLVASLPGAAVVAVTALRRRSAHQPATRGPADRAPAVLAPLVVDGPTWWPAAVVPLEGAAGG